MASNEHDLEYSNDRQAGIRRQKKGKGYAFYFENGEKVSDKATLKRLKSLHVPPVLKEVWYSEHPNTHLQATGIDEKGRKQYFYHQQWIDAQQEEKFSRLSAFAKALPRIREHTEADLRKHKWSRRKVLALIVKLLDEAFMRIGNWQYTRKNNSHGLITLRRKHLHVSGETIRFTYQGKSGQERKIHIQNGQLARQVKKSSDLPGYELFRYYDENHTPHRITSTMVNEYLKEISGEDFSCKDFRSWGGTVTAIQNRDKAQQIVAENKRKSYKTEIVRQVARQLGNTLSVCEKYYIHPQVLEMLVEHQNQPLPQLPGRKYSQLKNSLEAEELLALYLIEQGSEEGRKAA